MKFASSATLLLAAALSTLSAAQTIITQASVKPMIVKPGGLVTVMLEMVVSEDIIRKLDEENSPFLVGCQVNYGYENDGGYEMESLTFNKNGTKKDNNVNKRNKTENAKTDKPDKAARPGNDLLESDGIVFRSASIKPHNFPPKVVVNTIFFEDQGAVFFELPTDEIELLKKYTAIFKFRLGDDWDSGDIVPVAVGTSFTAPSIVNVVVR